MRGRKPKPNAIKLLQGNPGKRPIPTDQPEPAVTVPPCPPQFSDDPVTKNEWDRITKLLYDIKMISELDLAVIAAYCDNFSIWVKTSDEIKISGLVIAGQGGVPTINPWYKINMQAKTQLIKCAQELGLSPVQRCRISVKDKRKEEDPLEKFLLAK